MCHTDDSRAPKPPRRTGVASHEKFTLTALDGAQVAAFRARPAQPTGAGIVLLPDIRGLHPYYMDLAEGLADAGFDTVAFDFYARTAGTAYRDDSFDHTPHSAVLSPDHVRADAGAAAQILRADGARTVVSMGFCIGGGLSWRLASTDIGLDGSIGFYGRISLLDEVADEISAPLLMLLAGADRTPPEEFIALADRIRARGVGVETAVYDGAPHSFFDRTFDDWADACADSWRRIVSFVDGLTTRSDLVDA